MYTHSHGVASFAEMAQIVASNWKACDEDTMNFVTVVSKKLKEVYAVYEAALQKPTNVVGEDCTPTSVTYCMGITALDENETHTNTKRPWTSGFNPGESSVVSEVNHEKDMCSTVVTDDDHALFQSAMRQAKKIKVN